MYYNEAVELFPILDQKLERKIGSSLLFHPESWLEIKNKRKANGAYMAKDNFSVQKYFDYISLYPHKIMKELDMILDTKK